MAETAFINRAQFYDVAIIGAGVFGTWTAYQLHQAGRRVVLLDAYGAAHSRASSGGESRIIRCGYGDSEIYTCWALRSLNLWQAFFQQISGLPLFHHTGVLWMAIDGDAYSLDTLKTLERVGVPFERLSRSELDSRFPQINFGEISWGILELQGGALMARRAVQTLVQEIIKDGVDYLTEAVITPTGKGKLVEVRTSSGKNIKAGVFIFTCGPWLPKLFPEVLQDRIYPTKQDVFFFGIPVNDNRFSPPAMPTWVDFSGEVYGMPDLENRGFKIGVDRHGETFDPDMGRREVDRHNFERVRSYLAERFPAMKDAPLVETRVCQYENTSNGDFLIDRHPDFENVWFVGGGSGHGFKHGPALGEYVTARVIGETDEIDNRFLLRTKERIQERRVY